MKILIPPYRVQLVNTTRGGSQLMRSNDKGFMLNRLALDGSPLAPELGPHVEITPSGEAELAGWTTGQLRQWAEGASQRFDYAAAARFLREAVARYPEDPATSAAAADIAALNDCAQVAERLAALAGGSQ